MRRRWEFDLVWTVEQLRSHGVWEDHADVQSGALQCDQSICYREVSTMDTYRYISKKIVVLPSILPM